MIETKHKLTQWERVKVLAGIVVVGGVLGWIGNGAFGAYDGSGTFNRTQDFTADRDAGPPNNVISADKFDDELDGMATGMGLAILKDGQQTTTAKIPFGTLGISTDLITEDTAAAGVTIDSVLIKDNGVTATNLTGTLQTAAQANITSLGSLTSLDVAGTLTVDTIDETTSTAGVTIDSVLLKDNIVTATTGTFTNVGGTLSTAAQANITSVGTLTSLAVTGIATIGDVTLSAANPEVNGGDTDGALSVSSNTTTLGANLLMWGDTHATTAGDIKFRSDTTDTLQYDLSATTWDFQANDITTTGDITGSNLIFNAGNSAIVGNDPTAFISLAASSTSALGANLRLFGDTHATQAGDILFRNDVTTVLQYDLSATLWDFQANDISTTGDIIVGGTVDGVDVATRDHDAVTLAGTPDYITLSGQVITRGLIVLTTDVTGDLPVAEGGTGSSTAAGARTNLGVQAWTAAQSNSTSGTTVDFTGVTAGIDQFKIVFDRVSVTSSDEILIRLGTGGGPTYLATGYEGAAASTGASAANSTSFNINVSSGATDTWSGTATFDKMSDNTWIISGGIAEDNNTSGRVSFDGVVDLPAALTAIRVLNNGASTFDNGRILARTLE